MNLVTMVVLPFGASDSLIVHLGVYSIDRQVGKMELCCEPRRKSDDPYVRQP